jgi:hypothetical protein
MYDFTQIWKLSLLIFFRVSILTLFFKLDHLNLIALYFHNRQNGLFLEWLLSFSALFPFLVRWHACVVSCYLPLHNNITTLFVYFSYFSL